MAFVVALAMAPLTRWRDTSPSAPASTHAELPEMDTLVWNTFFTVLFPFTVALRTSFAVSQNDPHPLPGVEHLCSKVRSEWIDREGESESRERTRLTTTGPKVRASLLLQHVHLGASGCWYLVCPPGCTRVQAGVL